MSYWYYYINPNREGKGPAMWACKIDGKNMRRMNSIPDTDPEELDIVVLTNPIVDQNPQSKVDEKTAKGYVYACRFEDLTDTQAVAVGTFLTVAVRKISHGKSVESEGLWAAVEEHTEKEVQSVTGVDWTNLPPGSLSVLFGNTKEFCDRHAEKLPSAQRKGSFIVSGITSILAVSLDEIVRSFQFKEGTPSPIW